MGGVAAVALPLFLSDFETFEFGRVACVAIVLLALNVLTGHAGQISVGHGALMGVGAYSTAILVQRAGLPYWAAIPAAALLCAMLGVAVGLPALRIRGMYLGLVTLSLAIGLTPLLKRFSGLTGGPLGITPRPPVLLAPGLTPSQSTYLVSALVLVALLVVYGWVRRSFLGRRFAAVRASEAMAATCGIGIASAKTLAFAASSAMAGVAGGLYLTVVGTITPDSFTVTLSVTLLVAAVVGGLRSGAGPIAGALFFVFVPHVTAGMGGQAPQITYALVLLAAIYFFRDGLAALPGRLLPQNRSHPSEHIEEH
ncbi:branched-chain amino acid ABC transporter permease [Actinoallomurus acanthiterrae]